MYPRRIRRWTSVPSLNKPEGASLSKRIKLMEEIGEEESPTGKSSPRIRSRSVQDEPIFASVFIDCASLPLEVELETEIDCSETSFKREPNSLGCQTIKVKLVSEMMKPSGTREKGDETQMIVDDSKETVDPVTENNSKSLSSIDRLSHLFKNTNETDDRVEVIATGNSTNDQSLPTDPSVGKRIQTASQEEHCGCCVPCRDKMIAIDKKLNFLIRLLDEHPGHSSKGQKADFTLLPKFPLSSVQDIQEFEANLQHNAEMCQQYITRIAKIGGPTAKKFVRNVFSQFFTDEVAKRYSWTGQKKSLRMRDTKIANLIIETVLNTTQQCTISELQVAAQDWLRHAGDRWNYKTFKKKINSRDDNKHEVSKH